MTYKVKNQDFDLILSTLKAENKFAHKIFRNEILKGSKEWFSHCDNKSKETNNVLINALSDWLYSNDSELYDKVMQKAEVANLHLEVLEHFEQDKHPHVLEQEFERFINAGKAQADFDDKLAMYRNEY